MSRVAWRVSALCAPLLLFFGLGAHADTRLLRFPDLYGDQVVFTYAGDLWLAPATGGTARRLTAHPGQELFARFSPDGKWIAFTGQYDGDEQVYVMPAGGGVPRQLTFYPSAGPLPPRWGYDHQVFGWTPDGGAILFRSLQDGWDLTDGKLYTVPLEGGLPTALPMPESGAGDFSPDGGRIVYSPLFRDFRHWKRYEGGWAQDLFIFDLATHEVQRVTENVRSDRDPMWIGETIYFSSDRTGTLNLFAYDLGSGSIRQLTQSTVWDVRWPADDPATGRIVYELDGQLVIYDTAAGISTPIEIDVPTDAVARRPGPVDASKFIENIGLAPGGKRVVFSARGEIFTVPVEHGATRNLTRSSGAHDRNPVWSPDGATIAFISDADGEEEIWLVAQDGSSPARQLTDGNRGRLSQLAWAPDGKHLAVRDQAARLYVVDVESGEQAEIADDGARFGLDYTWSPHGGYLAFSLADPTGFRSLYVWSAASGEVHRLTGEFFNEYGPTWDPEGSYLFFLSDREFAPQIGSREFNYVVDRETLIYALALREDVEHPFPPQSDEVTVEETSESAASDGEEEGAETAEEEVESPIVIDFEGIAGRVARVPMPADNYFGIAAIKGHLLILKGFAPYYGRASDRQAELAIFSLEDREAKTLAEKVDDLAVSPDGTKVLVQSGGAYKILDASMGGKDTAKVVSTAGLVMQRDPAAEWAQIFHEVWRRYRDFFYVENMHGYDWQALEERYRPLLAHVGHRSDLNYLISEMIGELNVSHTYITGGDFEIPPRPHAGLLGARFALDAESGRYRIATIFEGENEEDRYRSPLTEVGVDVHEGDYLLAVNGEELRGGDNPFRLLRSAGGAPVELTVSARPDMEGARRVRVDPVRSEDDLLYLAWVERARRHVNERTGGRVGYLHLPNMGAAGIREWIKWFYPQIRREGLIVDVRNNGGGNVSPMIIERLQRELLMVDFERNVDLPDTYPDTVFYGQLVCLLDEDTASDGDQFAYVFRQAGLGPLIGKRSWGGVVGIYGDGPLIDGGGVTVPEAGSADPQGHWVVEGHGVDPDIVVENLPKAVLEGRDPQLDKAIEVVLAAIEAHPKRLPSRPADPVKTP